MYLERDFPNSKSFIRNSELIWIKVITPTSLSRSYTVQVKLKLPKSPRIKILEPMLNPPEGENLPHVYRNGTLCLYYPKWKEWDNTMLLADTIIPWISEWLLYYEIWLYTGKWCGGGKHPKIKNRKR